jgi:hypothetical protein
MTFRELMNETVDLKTIQAAVKKHGSILAMTSNGKWYSIDSQSLDDMDGDSMFVTDRDGHEKEILLKDISKLG